MRTINSGTTIQLSDTKGLRLAHAPMLGLRTLLAHVLGEATAAEEAGISEDVPSLLEMPAYQIPKSLAEGEADLGLWWDACEPQAPSGDAVATSELVVVTSQRSGLPRRPLVLADLHNLALVGFGGLGHRLLEDFCRRMATSDALVRFGNPHSAPDDDSPDSYMLVPGTPAAGELGPDLAILPLAQPIRANLVVADRGSTARSASLTWFANGIVKSELLADRSSAMGAA